MRSLISDRHCPEHESENLPDATHDNDPCIWLAVDNRFDEMCSCSEAKENKEDDRGRKRWTEAPLICVRKRNTRHLDELAILNNVIVSSRAKPERRERESRA